MLFFRKKEMPAQSVHADTLDITLRESFSNVKRDTALLFQWIQYLNKKQINAEFQLRKAIGYLPTREEIRNLIDSYYEGVNRSQKAQQDILRSDMEILKAEILILKKQMSENRSSDSIKYEVDQKLKEFEGRIEALRTISELKPQSPVSEAKMPSDRHFALKDKIIRSITRNSKDYVKSLALNMIRKYQKITGLQLRIMIVEEQGLASKSSFYRILEEIEKESEDISVFWDGKEKVYISKAHAAASPQTQM
jgi:hypothetical protein